MKIKLKLKFKDTIFGFINVTNVYIENSFLLIKTRINKTTLKVEPFDLVMIDYWEEISEKGDKKKKK